MTQPEWQRLEEWFAKAVELDAEARAVFLRERAAENRELAAELESLLASHAASIPAFQRPIVAQIEPRDRAGEWRLGEILGEGGLGVVRRAERTRGGGTEQGAVKYIHAGYDAGAFRARFLKEGAILRTLEHPAIARLLDGGMDEDGRPFLVMEYVDGRSWDRFMKESQPPLETRARLFRDLLDAVGYLHGRSVVHGDIKPSNVMVTASGQVKLLDFGAARMLDVEGRPQDSTFTRAMLTPGWASPEQTAGGACTVRSDIYSLGLLLRLSLVGLARNADLAAIAERATRDEPEERYAGAQSMRDDVDRFLRHGAVAAHRGNRWYRFRKFGRRNLVAIGLAACLALACGAVFWLWWSQRVRAERLSASIRNAPAPAEKLASVIGSVASQTPSGAASLSSEQVNLQLLLAWSKLNAGTCEGVDPPLALVAAALPKMSPGRTKEVARMRYLLMRGLCDARTAGKPESADMLDQGFQMREKLGAPDLLRPIFASRLSQLARTYMDSGELSRGAKLMRWAAVEAVRVGKNTEAMQMWMLLLTRLSREGGGKLLPEYCALTPPFGERRDAFLAICSAPEGARELTDAAGAEAALAQSPNSLEALARAVVAHQATAAMLQDRRKPREARQHMRRRLELLDRLVELEPDSERWQVMRQRALERFQKAGK